MFAYCLNQPTRHSDVSGFAPQINDADLMAMGGVAGELALLTLIGKVIDSYKEWLASKKKPVNLPSWKKLTVNKDHIASGHMPGGNRNPDDTKSVFYGVTAAQMMKIV
jgi:hypothetical protein